MLSFCQPDIRTFNKVLAKGLYRGTKPCFSFYNLYSPQNQMYVYLCLCLSADGSKPKQWIVQISVYHSEESIRALSLAPLCWF